MEKLFSKELVELCETYCTSSWCYKNETCLCCVSELQQYKRSTTQTILVQEEFNPE